MIVVRRLRAVLTIALVSIIQAACGNGTAGLNDELPVIASVELRGTVLDSIGAPLSGLVIAVDVPSLYVPETATTGTDGRFTLVVRRVQGTTIPPTLPETLRTNVRARSGAPNAGNSVLGSAPAVLIFERPPAQRVIDVRIIARQ